MKTQIQVSIEINGGTAQHDVVSAVVKKIAADNGADLIIEDFTQTSEMTGTAEWTFSGEHDAMWKMHDQINLAFPEEELGASLVGHEIEKKDGSWAIVMVARDGTGDVIPA